MYTPGWIHKPFARSQQSSRSDRLLQSDNIKSVLYGKKKTGVKTRVKMFEIKLRDGTKQVCYQNPIIGLNLG